MIKYFYRIVLLVFSVCFLIFSDAKAEYITGADITYKHISGNRYEFTVQVFADCDVVGTPPPYYSINYGSAICGVSGSFDVNQISETDISPVCPTLRSSCQGGTAPGINRYIYKGTIDLPRNCADWVFRWRECRRSDAIVNLAPGVNCLYIEAKLNNLNGNNNSPTFTADANGFVCVNQLTQYNPGAVETDGDRLAFTSVTPFTNINQTIAFRSGLSPSNPMPNTTGFSVDNSSGRVSFTASTVQRSVVTVLVQEFRNGTFIGSVMRDMQFLVRDCSNQLPQISGIDSTNNFQITACAGQTLVMNFVATDQDAGQAINLTYSGSLQGATFEQQTIGNRQKGTLTWIVPNNLGAGIGLFTITANDNACPIVGQRSASFSIRYSGELRIPGPNEITRVCTTATVIRPTVTGGQEPYTFLWPDNSTADSFSTDTSGVIRLEVTDSYGCKFEKTYTISSDIPSRFDSMLFCSTSGLTKVLVDTIAVTGANWVFEGGATFNTRQIMPNLPPGDHKFTLTLSDTLGCTKIIRDSIIVCPSPPRFTFNVPDSVCSGARVPINIIPQPGLLQCGLKKARVFVNNQLFDVFNFTGSKSSARVPGNEEILFSWPLAAMPDSGGMARISFELESIGGCFSNYDTLIKVLPKAKLYTSITSLPLPCNRQDSSVRVSASSSKRNLGVTIIAQALGGLVLTGDTIFSGIDSISAIVPFRGIGKIVLKATNGVGCFEIDTVLVIFPIQPAISIVSSCDKNVPVQFVNNSRSEFAVDSVRWNFGDGTFSNENNPTHAYVNEGEYRGSFTITDITGCSSTVSFTATHAWVVKGFDISKDTICYGESIMIRPNTSERDSVYSYLFFGNNSRLYTDSNSAKINYVYPVFGNQKVIHALRYGNRCIEVDTLPIFIIAPVRLGVDLVNNCIEDTATITARVISTPSPIVEYKWNLQFSPTRNGTYTFIDSLRGPSFRRYFPTRGFVKSRLTVRTQQGCVTTFDTTFRIVEVAPPVVTITGNCLNEAIAFAYDSTSDLYSNVETVLYDFGDGTTSQTRKGRVSKFYNASGTYDITTTVFSFEGCFNTSRSSVVVNPIPNVAFKADSVCLGINMVFDASESSVEGGISNYIWQFDTLATGTGVNTTFNWPASGTFNTRLTVVANSGCSETLIKQVKVFQLPVANFAFDPEQLIRGDEVLFTDASENALSWSWDFGDGVTFFTRNASERSPRHIFRDIAQFNVRLIVTSGSGCSDTIIKRVDLNPKLLLPTAYTPNGDGNNDSLVVIKRFMKQIDEFLIYDRWGRKVWESNKQFDDAWDGKVNGVLAEQGVYQVFLKATTIYGEPISIKGSVTLVR